MTWRSSVMGCEHARGTVPSRLREAFMLACRRRRNGGLVRNHNSVIGVRMWVEVEQKSQAVQKG